MHRVFISNLDLAPGRACAHVFRCFGYEVYGTIQDDDESQPVPAECNKIIPKPDTNYTEFQQGVLSCSVVIYDMLKPSETVAAFEICASAHNQRKFIAISTFMTWARTELPPAVEEEDVNLLNEDDLPDEKTMELEEVAQLYKQAKQPVPQWVIAKQEEIKRKEREELEAEAREKGEEIKEGEEKPEGEQDQPQQPAAEQQADDEEAPEEKEEVQEDEEEEEQAEPVDPEEELLKLPTYGFQETEFATRRPHPQFREAYEAENLIIQRLEAAQNITGAIVTPGIIYGYGETAMTNLFKRFYKQQLEKAPLYYGGHNRVIPFVHGLDLALLIHTMCVDKFPDKAEPFVFAVQRQHITARQLAESIGRRLLTQDPKREQIVAQLAKEKRLTKPKPLTKQTYRVWRANYNKAVPLPTYVAEINKNDTLLDKQTVIELTQNCPMQPGFAVNDILDGKWPLFARSGILENVELAWSEFLHVWGLEPVRIFIQIKPDIQKQLGKEVGVVISKHLQENYKTDADLTDMIQSVGRGQEIEQSAIQHGLLVIDCSQFTKEQLIQKIVLDKQVRNRGWVLINLPAGVEPENLFGQPAIDNIYQFYSDTGLKAPKKKKKTAEDEEPEPEPEEEDKPEWLAEDVEIDPEEKIQIIRSHILLPYTAPRNLFSFSKNGRQKLAEKPRDMHDFLDANCCLEHPQGFRMPKPQFIIELPSVYRYEQEVDQQLQEIFSQLDAKSLQIYRERDYEDQLRIRREHILNVKSQLIKIIQKKEEQEGDFDEENFNWTENYNLIGLDPRYDLKEIRIPKKEGIPEEEEKEEVDENGEPIPVPPKPINPNDYELGIEDISIYTKRQEEQAKRRMARKERNANRKQRTKNGDEEVSELEEEQSEPQTDENGNPLRIVPKARPFINTPKITPIEEIPEPTKHEIGYVWLMQSQNEFPIPLLKPTTADKNAFTHVCLQVIKFVGPMRDFPPSKQEKVIQQQKLKLQQEILRRIEEERLMREAEERRLAEERRQAELKFLREKYVKDEERRVLELAVPLRKYLSGAVLSDLIDGLVETAKIRPSDAVRFLGEFLMDRSVKGLAD